MVRSSTPRRTPQVKVVLLEGLLVAAMGAAFAFGVNAVSPRGLTLTRDYFPGAIHSSPPTTAPHPPTHGSGTNTSVSTAEAVAARLKAKDLRLINLKEMQQLFHDPRYAQRLIVFLDGRDEQHYRASHIPGAYLFDHYRAERYLAEVLLACQTAEQIVVYCEGGDCEDSEFAAVTLREVGVPNAKLSIYAGGFAEWSTNGLPVEVGDRNSASTSSRQGESSGNLRNGKK